MDPRIQEAKEKLSASLPPGFEVLGFSYSPTLFGNMSALVKGHGIAIEFGVDRGLIEGYVMWPGGKEITIEECLKSLGCQPDRERAKFVEGYSFDEFIGCLNDNLEIIRRMGQA